MSAALLACGGGQPAATPAEAGVTPSSEPVGDSGGGEVWSDTMSDKEKGAFMKKKVVPPMSKLFQEFDAKKFEKFDCKTCHGPSFKPHPQDFLPELHVKDGKIVEAAEHPEMAKFMGEKVTPAMAEIFGKKPYDPATHEGFGCGGCHKMNM
jgi:hypothetical protein